MASEIEEAPLVGRSALVRQLTDTLRHGPGAQPAGVFVIGESGVGKTRLLREAAARARAAGAAVLAGACLDIGDASPLHPLLQALRRSDEARAGSDAAARLLEVVQRESGGPDTAGALLEQVAQGLHRLADGRPLVLVLDDLQWVDRSTRQLLLYLLAGLGGVQLSVLAAVRAEALQGAHPLRRVLTELRRLRSVTVVDLGPLDRAGTDELAAAVVGRPLGPGEAEQVWDRSGGNPFVVEELARDLRDGRAGPSDTLREIFLSRVDALPEHAHAVLHAVAAGVEPVEHALLARVVTLPEAELIDAVRAAVTHRFLVGDDDGYRLRHRVVAEILAHELLPVERAALHRRYAEAVAAAPSAMDQQRLAHHWARAGEPDLALAAAVAAAREAERLHGWAEAHRHWSAALELGPAADPGRLGLDRPELVRRAAEAAHRCGEHARALALLDEVTDGEPTCEQRLSRARYLAAAGRSAPAETEYEAVLAATCDAAERADAAARLAELLLHLGRYADAGERGRAALALAEPLPGATSALVRASAAVGFSSAFADDSDAGLRVVRQAVEIAERAGDPDDLGCAYLHLAELMTGPLNKLDEGVVVARRGAERMGRLPGGRSYQTRLLAIAANGLFRAGLWAEAEKEVAAGLQNRPSGAEAVELLLARCRLSVGYGDEQAAERDLEAVATILAGGGARHVLPLLTLRAGLAMWRGRHDEARQAVRRGLTETRSDDLFLLAVLAWHGLRAEAEAHAARAAVDAGSVRLLTGVVDRVTARNAGAARPTRDVVAGYLDLAVAERSRLDETRDPGPWARLAELWDSRHHPYPAAYARLRQAEALFARRPKSAPGTAALRSAYDAARALGAQPLAAEITALAARVRVAVGDAPAVAEPPPDGLAALTAREREVLEAVAEGLTNREIGQRLFISERTVGVHVSHIFDKLQVRTRVQASRLLLRGRDGPT
ncbi:helix-turn-helix transcriptional regulator [Spirilliplanes yamanashiensis]|uniref:Helix-turn-helix transcriptional regulator n=1 Tax=Spirilliplanes yamanashiensis TaxID=42233 RepID=A0A8J4DKI9_9ACTN|nr:helix-turn-helix transcriptional regulator [Spirilliplanes yamanashiensis]MDP9818898.1 DNA-binding CsgD family transcriptional regulator/tetratricopeptide (TPR) repeat protein [Spirilliplanes yamanashiensis]GIJ05352.1 helix-turn-helix transcriptional regulator [Spirilliplanes yamanashiensis]